MSNQIVFVNGKSKCGCTMEYTNGCGEYSDVHTITPCAEHSRPEASLHQRIAELERSETQLIAERDNAETALNDAYKAVMGQDPEWSNWFSFADAIDEIELACELSRNQTEDVIQFRARIEELEARVVKLPERYDIEMYPLPVPNGEWYSRADILASLRTAGIRIHGEG